MQNDSLKIRILLIISGLIINPFANALDYDTALQRVLDCSLELRVSEADICIRDAEKEEAGYFINPVLSIEGDDIGSHDPEASFGISQEFEIGNKRSSRQRYANTAKCLAYWDYTIKKTELSTRLTHHFIDIAVAQEKLKIAEEQKNIADQMLTCVSTKVESGKEHPLEHKKSLLACNSFGRAYAKANTAFLSAKRKLSLLWGSQCLDFDSVTFPLTQVSPPQPFESYVAQLEQSPDIARQNVDIALNCDAVSLEKARRIPNVTVSTGVTGGGDENDRGWFLGFDIPLPVYNQNQAQIRRTEFEKMQAIYQKQDFYNNALTNLYTLYDELTTAYNDVVSLRDSGLPAAKEAFAGAREGYERGKYEYLHMLDAQRTYYEIVDAYIDALAEYHHKYADLARLTSQG